MNFRTLDADYAVAGGLVVDSARVVALHEEAESPDVGPDEVFGGAAGDVGVGAVDGFWGNSGGPVEEEAGYILDVHAQTVAAAAAIDAEGLADGEEGEEG